MALSHASSSAIRQVISTSFASTRVAGSDAYISAVNEVDLIGKMVKDDGVESSNPATWYFVISIKNHCVGNST